VTVDICLPIATALQSLNCRLQFPEPLPSLVVVALNRRAAGTVAAAGYVTKIRKKCKFGLTQVWVASSYCAIERAAGIGGATFFPGDS